MPQHYNLGPPSSFYGQDPYPLESGTTTTVGEGGAGQSARAKALIQSMMIQKLLGAGKEFGGGGPAPSLTPIPRPGGMRSPGVPAPARPFNPMGAPIGMGRPSEISGGLTGHTRGGMAGPTLLQDIMGTQGEISGGLTGHTSPSDRQLPGQMMPGGMTGNTSPRDIQMLLELLRSRGGGLTGHSGMGGGTGF
jgi:hypothetical protein